MKRSEVTEMIVAARVQKGIPWSDVAKAVGGSKEWVTAGCLGADDVQRQADRGRGRSL